MLDGTRKISNILYYGGLWPTNMGNSFIDLGALYLLKNSCPQTNIHQASRFSRFYAQHRGKHRLKWLRNSWKPLDVAEHTDVDYVVVAGNVTHTDFIKVEGPTIRTLVKRGAKFIILGGGRSVYTRSEQDAFREFMQSVQTYAFISRDKTSYEAFHDVAQYAYAGIDCAFFLADAFRPMKLRMEDYVVCTFDDQKFERSLNLKNEPIVRARHYNFGIRERFQKKINNTLVSDLPDDYISLYAGAKAVYSDRVHACAAALAFGRHARLYSNTPRAQLFGEVGAGDIQSKLVEVDHDLLQKRKRGELNFLSSLFDCTPTVLE